MEPFYGLNGEYIYFIQYTCNNAYISILNITLSRQEMPYLLKVNKMLTPREIDIVVQFGFQIASYSSQSFQDSTVCVNR